MHQPCETGAEAGPTSWLGHAEDLRILARCLASSDAADLVQDTWVAALQANTRPRTAGTWLRQVMRNQFRGTARSTTRRRGRERETPHDETLPALDDTVMQAELELAMHEALGDLDEPYRTVVRARFLGGRSPTDIALGSGIPPATVRWQIHEGLRRIREGLDARYGDRRHWHGGALAIAGWTPARSKGVTTMTRFAMLKWFAGLSIATGATAAIVVQGATPAVAQAKAAPESDAAPMIDVAPTIAAPTTRVLATTPDDAPLDPPNAPAAEGECEGECEGDARPFRTLLTDDSSLAAAFASCEHLVPADAKAGRFEIEVMVRGGAEGAGNTITAASVTRGRKIPCFDPDATFDEPDPPDMVRFDALAECIEHSLSPDFVQPVPEGEERAIGTVLGDTTRPPATAPLPEASAQAKTIDPEQAIAHFGLQGTSDPARAKVSVVECGGYDCSFCRRAQQTIDELRDRYGDALSFHFLQMPLDMHPTGALAARAAVAAARQGKSWEMHAALFDEPTLRTEAALVEHAHTLGLDADRFARDLADPATAQTVADQREVCTAAGARGTPSFFINGDLLVGSQEIEAFTEIIDDELASEK